MPKWLVRTWGWLGSIQTVLWLWGLGGSLLTTFTVSLFADLEPWQTVALALGVFLVILAAFGTWVSGRSSPESAAPDLTTRKHFKNETVKLADLISADLNIEPILDGYIFEDCVIVGPAVLFILPGPPNGQITAPVRFSAPLEASILSLGASVKAATGLIGVRGVQFIRPDFRWVSFGADEQRAKDLKTAILEVMTTGGRTELRHGQPLAPKPKQAPDIQEPQTDKGE